MTRFDRQPAPELVESAFRFETEDAPLLHHDLTRADLAHLLHLHEQRIISAAIARALLRRVLELDADAAFSYQPERGDAFTNREHWLTERAPEQVGYYSTGRARREATTIAFRLRLRRDLLGLLDALGRAQAALLDLAAEHTATVMPDYTYLQQAHPTTFAHYLLGFAYPLARDVGRLREVFGRVNRSPAGIGSTNGSRLPLNRERLAEWLGFDGVIEHTRDAMWQVDVPLDAVNAGATLLVHLDRLAEDLQIFNSVEFGFIELADAYARASVIMPQKKNPYPLGFVRGAAGVLFGRVAEMYAIARTPSAQVDNRIMAHGDAVRALDLTARATRLMGGVVGTLRARPERMRQALDAGFTQATDLAEMLAEQRHLSYAAAHEIVSRVVRDLMREGKTARDLTPERLNETARELGYELNLTREAVQQALDPEAIVRTRTGTGGAAPERVSEMVDECRARLGEQTRWLHANEERIARAEARLREAAKVV